MNIDVLREACCSQDDQLGPLEKRYELPGDSTLQEFLAAVMASRFLQFSSSHVEMSCRVGGKEVARVFSPYELPRRSTEFSVPAETHAGAMVGTGVVEFVFDRV